MEQCKGARFGIALSTFCTFCIWTSAWSEFQWNLHSDLKFELRIEISQWIFFARKLGNESYWNDFFSWFRFSKVLRVKTSNSQFASFDKNFTLPQNGPNFIDPWWIHQIEFPIHQEQLNRFEKREPLWKTKLICNPVESLDSRQFSELAEVNLSSPKII